MTSQGHRAQHGERERHDADDQHDQDGQHHQHGQHGRKGQHDQNDKDGQDGQDDATSAEERVPKTQVGRGRRDGVGEPVRGVRGRRRVDAPATNPGAEDADDVSESADQPSPPRRSPRDDWIRAQRPPHWD